MQIPDLHRIFSSLLRSFNCSNDLSIYNPLVDKYGFEATILGLRAALEENPVEGYFPSVYAVKEAIRRLDAESDLVVPRMNCRIPEMDEHDPRN